MKRLFAKSVIALAAAASIVPAVSAKADNFHVGGGYIRDDRRDARYERRWIEPVYEERMTQVWCEPVYRTEYVPHWVKPYYNTVCDRVYVQPVYETREVVSRDRWGHRVVRTERVCVREGGWKNVERQELVPGHYKNEPEQVLVTAGHYERKCDRVCVREGHWDNVRVDDGRRYDGRERFSVNFGFGLFNK
jgi:hypothetical protein